MGTKERREKEKAALKIKILETAMELAKHEGWEAVSMRKIAHKIDYSVGSLYQYFENKTDILLHLHVRGFMILNTWVFQSLQNSSSPLTQMLLATEIIWKFATTQEEFYRLMFYDEEVLATEEIEEKYFIMKQITPIFKTRFPHLSPPEVSELYHHWWALVQGYILIQLTQPSNHQFTLNSLKKAVGRLVV